MIRQSGNWCTLLSSSWKKYETKPLFVVRYPRNHKEEFVMAAPTKESPFITVVLKHVLPDESSHYDWLLAVDADGKKPLVSFRVKERPDLVAESRWVDIEARPDHRPEYLNLEGELEGGRGTVERLAKGSIFMWKEITNGWNMMVEWDDGRMAEFELLSGAGILAFRRIFEDQSQEPAPPLPKAKMVGDVPVDNSEEQIGLQRKITAFGETKKDEATWARTPNITGEGATHVRSFHSKLTDDALGYVDKQINAWLDDNPDIEVKFVTTTIGTFTGKVKEPHLICQVWV